jgi:hypothetical protein
MMIRKESKAKIAWSLRDQSKCMIIRNRLNAKVWLSESDQRQRYGEQKAIKGKSMMIRKRLNADVGWSENDKM